MIAKQQQSFIAGLECYLLHIPRPAPPLLSGTTGRFLPVVLFIVLHYDRNMSVYMKSVAPGTGSRKDRKPKDITGRRKGKLVAICCLGTKHLGGYVWEWKCDCGNTIEKTIAQVQQINSCGCARKNRRRRKSGNFQEPAPPVMVETTSMPRFVIHKKVNKVET
ncbi:MAG: hypothetical protein LBS97_03975 [Treponema sp.]|jgi:hypothetical protein|nr:hypothetical protein [Treponema sp.]